MFEEDIDLNKRKDCFIICIVKSFFKYVIELIKYPYLAILLKVFKL